MKAGEFRGKVGGVVYTDAKAFEEAARALGYRRREGRKTTWRIGTEVAVIIDGQTIGGQVWSLAEGKGWHWLALDNGAYVAAYAYTGRVHMDPRLAESVGRIA